jgi:hypothetical protein
MNSGSQGAKEASLYVSLLVLYSNVGHKITAYFLVATFTHRNRYPLAMYNQNITLSLFLSIFLNQGKKSFGENVTDPHVVQLVDHVRYSLLVER